MVCEVGVWSAAMAGPPDHLIPETPENERLINRLYNWKFESAERYLEGQPETVCDAVKALSAGFGDCGWFWGTHADLVRVTVTLLIGKVDE